MYDKGTPISYFSAIRAVTRFGEVVGHEILQTILPQLKVAVIEDPKWRVRSEAINAVVNLALCYQVLQHLFRTTMYL
jgi:hypothetical protein